MTIKEKLNQDLKVAMKSKDKETLTTIRLITSTIKNKEIEVKKELKDEEVFPIIQKEMKQTQESIEGYEKAPGDYDRVIQELKTRLDVLKNYLPKQLTEEEITVIVKEAITKTGAVGKSEMGKVMGLVMPQVKGKADGKLVNKIVLNELN